MGSWRSWLGLDEKPRLAFSESAPMPIDRLFREMRFESGSAVRVSREEALRVPAVLRARNMICSTATLPLITIDKDRKKVRNPLFEQIDPAVANEVTLARTLDDLFFEAVAWWEILEKGSDGKPSKARQVDQSRVKPVDDGEDYVTIDDRKVSVDWVIRFDSPNPGLLTHAGRPIRRALDLDAMASMYAKNPRPLDYFSIEPGMPSPFGDEQEAQDFLDDWSRSRLKRSTGLIPEGLKYNTVDAPTPAELQLIENQSKATLDLANATGLDPEDMGISTTSRSYFNADQRRRERINDVFAPFMVAVTSRLSMNDVTVRGNKVRFDLDDYMKSDPATRVAYYQALKDMGAITVDEIREEEGLPELTAAQRRELAPPVQPAKPDPNEESNDGTV